MLATELRKTEVVMLDGFINGMRQTIEDNAGYRRIFELLYKILPIEEIMGDRYSYDSFFYDWSLDEADNYENQSNNVSN